MAKLTVEADETRLTKKVSERRGAGKPAGDLEFRALRKHLKRLQRKRRRLALRKRHAMGKKTGAAPSPPVAPAS
jgi:hypothetical protein